MEQEYAQFLFMRTDMNSMTAGKAIAQGMHAANAMENFIWPSKEIERAYMSWKKQAGDFGTSLVFRFRMQDFAKLEEIVYDYNSHLKHSIDIIEIWDPSYPIKDGEITHYIKCLTCLVIFAPREFGEILNKNGFFLY